jgi:F420-dependent methylenetetrahydromethanopterin dehydrogenase
MTEEKGKPGTTPELELKTTSTLLAQEQNKVLDLVAASKKLLEELSRTKSQVKDLEKANRKLVKENKLLETQLAAEKALPKRKVTLHNRT